MENGFQFDWKRMDPEARWGLPAKKYTGVNVLWAFFLGCVYTMIFYGLLYLVWRQTRIVYVDMFFFGGEENRSWIPISTVFLSMWCYAILRIKYRKVKVQQKILTLKILPETPGFILSPDNSAAVQRRIDEQVYQADGFLVLNRIQKTLANLKNIGRVADVSSVLNNLAAADEKYIEGTYTFPKGLIWAIPVTGFIGTVLGLSDAVGGFGKVIRGGEVEVSVLKNSLGGVTGGLSVAFETTLIALVAALFLQLLMTMIMQKEEDLMDQCAAYCYDNVVSKLKMIDMGE